METLLNEPTGQIAEQFAPFTLEDLLLQEKEYGIYADLLEDRGDIITSGLYRILDKNVEIIYGPILTNRYLLILEADIAINLRIQTYGWINNWQFSQEENICLTCGDTVNITIIQSNSKYMAITLNKNMRYFLWTL